MNWIDLNDEAQLATINEQSKHQPIMILKHSTRCSISQMAKNRLDKEPNPTNTLCYYLDLLKFRPISNKIAELYKVTHESPQILIIKNGECTYEDSHNGINIADIIEQTQA